MSIYVMISRRAEPLDENGAEISSADWLAVASTETDFRLPVASETDWSGAFAQVWTGHDEYPVVFDWVAGEVEVKSPDQQTLARMKALAARLGATVFSETGEIFAADGASLGFLDGYP